MIKELVRNIAEQDDKPPITLTMLGGDVFPNVTITDYDDETQEIAFICTEVEVESEIYLDDDDNVVDSSYTEVGQKIVRYIWRIDNIVGIGTTTLSLSEDLLVPSQQTRNDLD